MNVEIISMEMIKPSSPTPIHLKNFNLSILDQLIPVAYAPIVLFYPNNDSATRSEVLERLVMLKKSLSKILTLFYPLAGTTKDELSIDCDDQGACFITTEVDYSLSEFLASPILIGRFVPCGLLEGVGSCVTNIQANVFECGGIAIGVCVSHKFLDGTALSTFLKSWAGYTTSSNEELFNSSSIIPDFSASSLFPASDLRLRHASMAIWDSFFKKGQFVTKRYLFDGSAIATLREEAKEIFNPTRVETISAFIWKCAIESHEVKSKSKKHSVLTHTVNLRKRASPKLSDQSLGNLIWITSAKITTAERQYFGFSSMMDEVRKSISKIDSDYVNKLKGGEGAITLMQEHLKEMKELGTNGFDHFMFTSWCKLGYYDVDFGWGKPIWVSSTDASGSYFMNIVILVDTRCGTGIEAWVTMDEQEMDMLEHNQEFRTFALLNPSPLDVGNDVHV